MNFNLVHLMLLLIKVLFSLNLLNNWVTFKRNAVTKHFIMFA